MTQVESSNLQEYGYDAATETLRLKFRNGKSAYEYANVPQSVVAELAGAESKGLFVARRIVKEFKCTKLEKE